MEKNPYQEWKTGCLARDVVTVVTELSQLSFPPARGTARQTIMIRETKKTQADMRCETESHPAGSL